MDTKNKYKKSLEKYRKKLERVMVKAGKANRPGRKVLSLLNDEKVSPEVKEFMLSAAAQEKKIKENVE